MGAALWFLFSSIIDLIVFVVIVNAIISWLIAFDVLNIRNQTVAKLVRALDAVTNPLLKPIRRFMPTIGGLDLSPIILILLLQALRILVASTLTHFLIPVTG